MYEPVRAQRGTSRTAVGWPQEAAVRMLMNNLDPEVAERPEDLVVYGGTGKAARDWPSYHAMIRTLGTLRDDETMLVQSGRPVGVVRTHEWAPRVLIANSNLVGDWATWPEFRRLEQLGLTMYGQMTAGSWIYIGTQGILQGTFETFAAVAESLVEEPRGTSGVSKSVPEPWAGLACPAWTHRVASTLPPCCDSSISRPTRWRAPRRRSTPSTSIPCRTASSRSVATSSR